jgi:predicted PurR-regulated permease PerM
LFNVVTSLVWSVFILVISFYILKDQPKISRYAYQLTPPRYRSDARLLNAEINAIWSAFLRGQLLLSLIIGIVVGITMAIVGLRNAVALGALAGALEVIPNLGPVIAAAPAVLIALFQGSTYLPLSPFWFALLVAGLYALIQQVENNYLVPRILGSRLHLHPLAIIVAIVAGANLAGVLGALLAAPTLATLRVFAAYAYRKLLDMPPFPMSEEQGSNQPEPPAETSPTP